MIPRNSPRYVSIVNFFVLKKIFSIITTLKGYNAPISALSPVGINLRLQVLSPLAHTNINTDITKIHLNCLTVGRGNFLYQIKKPTKQNPAINCLIYAICNAGISFTPILLATQVVPQTMLVIPRAIYPFPLPPTFLSCCIARLMFEMPGPGKDHSQIIIFAIFNRISIPY